jgi:hypothetical protein
MAWMRRVAMAALAAGVLAGCSASPDRGEPVAETCDGGPSVGNPETAIRTLVDAASEGDTALACTVASGTPEGTDLGQGLAELKTAVEARGLTAENLRVEEIGDTGRYMATGPASSDLEPLDFLLQQVEDKGYRIFFPEPEERNL